MSPLVTNVTAGAPVPDAVWFAHGAVPSPAGPVDPFRKRSNSVPLLGYDCCCELEDDWPENSHQWLGPLGGWVPVLYVSLSAYCLARLCRSGTELMWFVLSTVPLQPAMTVVAQSPR